MLIHSVLYDHDTSPQPAVVCADKGLAVSYAELSRISRGLADGFLREGLREGDRVAILLPNSIEFVAALFGTVTAGAVAVPMDIYLKRDDLLAILATIKPRILVTNHNLLRKIRTELKGTTVCLAEYDGTLSLSFTESGGEGADGDSGSAARTTSPEHRLPRLDPAGDALIIMSSGSTGLPKAVRLSHRAVRRNIAMHLASLDLEPGEDIRGLQVLPMNFSYGLIASFLSILATGGTAVLLPYLEPKLLFETLARHDINLFMGTPTIFQYLIEHSGTEPSLPALRCITLGGDRCKRYTLNLIRDRFPAARVYITYGLSEAGPRVSTLPHDRIADAPHSVGLPLRGVEVTILDGNGRKCPPLEPGEIVVKTPSLMNGYFGDEELTSRVVRSGLCHSGDIGYLDEEGLLYYVGRKDRRFKFGGRYVNPSFIEQCIASHPHVEDVSVEKTDQERTEVICARIKAKNVQEQELLQELKRLCLQHMPAYMVPGEFLFEDYDHYSYKGKKFVPVRKQLS